MQTDQRDYALMQNSSPCERPLKIIEVRKSHQLVVLTSNSIKWMVLSVHRLHQ
jgi:hypothetical protein